MNARDAVSSFVSALALVAVLSLETRAHADDDLFEPAARQGYYLAGGFRSGPAMAHADEVGSLGLALFAQSIDLRFGQVVDRRLGFGLALDIGGGARTDDWSRYESSLSMEAQYVPILGDNLAIRGGIGIGFAALARNDESKATTDDPDGALTSVYSLGLSYDWFPTWDPGDGSGGFAVTVALGANLAVGERYLSGGFFSGIAATYWFGFRESRLAMNSESARQ